MSGQTPPHHSCGREKENDEANRLSVREIPLVSLRCLELLAPSTFRSSLSEEGQNIIRERMHLRPSFYTNSLFVLHKQTLQSRPRTDFPLWTFAGCHRLLAHWVTTRQANRFRLFVLWHFA